MGSLSSHRRLMRKAAMHTSVVDVDVDVAAAVEVDVEDVDNLEIVLVNVLAGVDEIGFAEESVLLLRSMLRMLMCCSNWPCDERKM
eukprot:6475268-Amphidinium_carterae.1